jgi:Mn2+/Fe2+ NRAMP family transporter
MVTQDQNPSGIGAYSQAGAQFGHQLLWTMLWSYPLLVVIQGISARLGRTTGRGIAANIRDQFSPTVLYATVLALASPGYLQSLVTDHH